MNKLTIIWDDILFDGVVVAKLDEKNRHSEQQDKFKRILLEEREKIYHTCEWCGEEEIDEE